MAQGRSIDHVVIAVPDLDAAAASYEDLGFTLTPRAFQPDNMGTSNRLAQFKDDTFIELLEVDRPDGQDPHAFAAKPPRFSFGAHNRIFLEQGSGMSMLAFAGEDCRADLAAFDSAGLRTYAPFDFERRARQPDGGETHVAFTLGFVTSPAMPRLAFFVCQAHLPAGFWNPTYQSHANGAQGIAAIVLAAERPEDHRDFLGALTGSPAEEKAGGLRFARGGQAIEVATPDSLAKSVSLERFDFSLGPQFVGIALGNDGADAPTIPADAACGAFIAWTK